jgi:hypothetical protein
MYVVSDSMTGTFDRTMHIYFSYNWVPELASVPYAQRKVVIRKAASALAGTAEGRSLFRLFLGWLFLAAASTAFFISLAGTKLSGELVATVIGVIWQPRRSCRVNGDQRRRGTGRHWMRTFWLQGRRGAGSSCFQRHSRWNDRRSSWNDRHWHAGHQTAEMRQAVMGAVRASLNRRFPAAHHRPLA